MASADQHPEVDEQWMRRALRLAARADYRTSPNPMVGAVLLDRRGNLAGEGWHRSAGSDHAEAIALARAAGRAHEGTAYVTLEPCPHHGRTPPCADALIAAGLRRTVVGLRDPDVQVAGRGLERLRAAGLEVSEGVLAAEAAALNRFYLQQRRTGLPFVTVKFAASLDGRIATRTGESRWVTGEAARLHAHRLRHQHDAILVGAGTVLADDPELSARLPNARQPLRVVLSSRGRVPSSARALRGEHLLDDGRDLPGLLRRLGERGILSVLVEGGGQVHGAFFDQQLVDQVFAYLAPTVIGGAAATPPVAGLGAASMAAAWRLTGVRSEWLGSDLVISGYVHRDRQLAG
ncbi:MAG: bifunctional diaminohydroxyphosphoribosylaminopyrimidine deaminase/5-amino-6-(5-phosphoribosylamino)uracil reductase RibD [Candidatus Dormibacter sp.]|uniref:bifunctional diaminohydroxyphosphoribosylaminopyrimidine deaminase/5-amino-6-(5-phosphoribosylamino)uracil reductase RibD n=1 Tax=Candidatus Dormibacter sp. TaxID=2973982 RepID=UPI003D9B0AB9